jgi:hypothetical protein
VSATRDALGLLVTITKWITEHTGVWEILCERCKTTWTGQQGEAAWTFRQKADEHVCDPKKAR